MPAPLTQEDLERYGNVLAEIKYRIDLADKKLQDVAEIVEFDSAALQLRKSIELIALATLAVNRQSVAQESSTIHRKNWREACKVLRKVNPGFWPTPFQQGSGEEHQRVLNPLDAPFLAEEHAGAAWGFLSNLVHASNPFAPMVIDQDLVSKVSAISTEVKNLLGLHTADLGNREHLVLAALSNDGHFDVVVLNGVSIANSF
jgi:Ni,Fe-hydrogenase III component G